MSEPYPLVVPDELQQEIRSAAQRTGLSMADITRAALSTCGRAESKFLSLKARQCMFPP